MQYAKGEPGNSRCPFNFGAAVWIRPPLTRSSSWLILTAFPRSTSMLRRFTVLSTAFLIAGAGLLLVSTILVWRTSTFIRSSRTAPGRVVDLEWRNGSSGRGTSGGYATVFAFTDGSGRAHTVRTKSTYNPPTHRIGAAVEVLFQPENPEDAKIRSFQTLWLIPVALAGAGVGFAGAGACVFVAARRRFGSFVA